MKLQSVSSNTVAYVTSGAGTNLKVGGGGHQSGAKVRGPVRHKAPENFFLVAPLHFFGSKSTISRFGERFRDGQYIFVSFLFAVLLTVPPPRAQPFVKGGEDVSPCPIWNWRH